VLSNRFYLISSICFLTGAILAFQSSRSLINGMALAGSACFLVAAIFGLAKK
jgi:hypothetical protein